MLCFISHDLLYPTSCYAIDDDTVIRRGDTVVLNPRDPTRRRIPPRIVKPVEHELIDFEKLDELDILCEAIGSPPPTVEWFQNEQPLGQAKMKRHRVSSERLKRFLLIMD